MGDKLANILGGILTIALVTTVVLPGRQSAKVIDAFGDAFSGSIRAALGK